MSVAKDPRERVRRNAPAVLSGVSPALPPPKPPKGLSRALRAAWLGLWRSPVAQLLDPVSDLQAVLRLFTLYGLMERVDARLVVAPAAAGEASAGDPETFHLDVQARVRLSAEARQLEQALGLSPRSRLALGLALLAGARQPGSLDDASEAADDDA